MVSSGWNRLRQRGSSVRIAVGTAICLTLGTLGTLPVAALGLGEIDTRSALNERFAAEIELLDTRGLDDSEVLASLASTDDFRRVGVERFFFLTSLKFDVTRNPRGNLVIKASSLQPITEPYLNFLVEVLWPSGRLLKEYTVLLDPPTFTHSAAAPVAAPSREQTDVASAGRIQRTPAPVTSPSKQSAGQVKTPARSSRPSAVSTPIPQVASNDGTYGRTTRNDTMWAIANQTLPSGNVTPQQHMLAIQRLNPTAFIDGNVNLLKAGVVLRLPSEGEAGAISTSSAVAEIDQQTQAWRAGSPSRASATATAAAIADANATTPSQASAATIDATSRGPGDAGSAPVANDGRLRIVSAEVTGAVDSIDNAGSSDEATAVVGDPAAKERLADMSRQVDELTYQLDLQKRGVEEQISDREKTINLKDRQIAQLEAQLKIIRENAANSQQQDQSTPQTIQADAQPWWQRASVLGSVLGGLALLLAGVLFSRRRQNSDDLDIDDIDSEQPTFALAPSTTNDVVTPIADADLLGDLDDTESSLEVAAGLVVESELSEDLSNTIDNDELSDDDLFGPADDAAPAAAARSGDSAQTSDVIGEADIYIAYGRYPQAIALLQGAVEANPQDHAVRMRLLEVSAETKDVDSYATHALALREHCSDGDTLAAADALHASLDADLRDQIDALGGTDFSDDADPGLMAGAATLTAGVAGAFADDTDDSVLDGDLQDELLAGEDDLTAVDEFTLDEPVEAPAFDSAEPFAFDTTVTDVDAQELDSELTDGFSSDLADEGEFELDLDLDVDNSADLDALTAEMAADKASDFDVPAVNTDQFATNVDMEVVENAAEDFELDLDIGGVEGATDDLAEDNNLGGDLGLDFPDDTADLASLVADTDDDQLLDEIERSLDELEADGLLTPELSEEGDFSFDDDADTSATKLDLARAYIDMGDDDGAREILGEVISEGDNSQKGEANQLLDKL